MDYRKKTKEQLIEVLKKLNSKYDQLKLSYEEDISARDKAERKLLLSEEKFRKAFVTSPDSININRLDNGMYISINNGFTRITGYTEEEIMGKSSLDLNIWADPSDRDRLAKGLKEKGEVENLETKFVMKDGSIRNGMMSATLIDLDGIPHILSITRDITERKIAENEVHELNAHLEERVNERTAQLEEVNKELEAFSYSISHDLRAPLRAIDGFSKFVVEDYGEILDYEGKRLLGLIRNNTQKMDKLITDILALSRISRSEHKLATVDMTKMVKSMFNEVVSSDEHVKLSFIVGELPFANADATYLKQVWINLISNAVKFSSPRKNPVIRIGGFTENGNNIYYIEDNGVGFNQEYVHKLFGVFQRLHKVDEFEGTGVGLAIVKRIILRHGGKVWAKGKEGKGATFYFSLPVI